MKRFLVALVSIALLLVAGLYVRQIFNETIESPVVGQRYVVGIGDSVAAGAGLNPDRNPRNPGCDLADTAFPVVLSQRLKQPIEQLACSGAIIGTSDQVIGNTAFKQLRTGKAYMTDADVVVTVGANDVGWLQVLLGCANGDCATDKNRETLAAKLETMSQQLTELLTQITQTKPRRVVVNTYYELLSAGSTCLQEQGLTSDEVSFIREQQTRLNAAITAAATQAKVTVVTVDFSGHTLCDADSWIQGVTDPAPLHPTVAGQRQIAIQDAAAIGR